MNLHSGRVQLQSITIEGSSTGGLETAISIPQFGVCVDMGIAGPSTTKAGMLLITHGHPDHMGALIAYLGKRLLYRLPPPKIVLDKALLEGAKTMVAGAERMQGRPLPAEWHPISPGERLPIKGDLQLEAFRSMHVIPTTGYAILSCREKLKAEHQSMSGEEIKNRRLQGDTSIFEEVETTVFAVTGDTLPDVIDRQPRVQQAQTLMTECTFLDDTKGPEIARKGGHIHLDELLPRLELLQAKDLVLTHFSQLYSPSTVRRILAERIPEEWHGRVHALTRGNRKGRPE